MKTCNNCWITKKLTEFYTKGKKPNWETKYAPDCKYCIRIKRNNQYKDRYISIRWKIIPEITEYKEKSLVRNRVYYTNNKERINEQKRNKRASLTIEEKQKRNKQITKAKKIRQQKEKLDLINKKRLWLLPS